MSTHEVWRYVTFATDLGWMALGGNSSRVARLTFGHKNEAGARRALGKLPRHAQRDDVWFGDLVERLQAYARGAYDDFRDVAVDCDEMTDFGEMVVHACRQIPPGATLSYGDLAAVCGRPRAARAVGNVMRSNRVPLIVPCHRVVGSNGRLHGYSAAGGLNTKQRLLDLEIASRLWAGVAEVAGAV